MIIYQNLPYKNATCTAKFYEDRIDATIFFSLASAVRKTTLSQDADVIIFRQQSQYLLVFLRYKMVWNILKCFFFFINRKHLTLFINRKKRFIKKRKNVQNHFKFNYIV